MKVTSIRRHFGKILVAAFSPQNVMWPSVVLMKSQRLKKCQNFNPFLCILHTPNSENFHYLL